MREKLIGTIDMQGDVGLMMCHSKEIFEEFCVIWANIITRYLVLSPKNRKISSALTKKAR